MTEVVDKSLHEIVLTGTDQTAEYYVNKTTGDDVTGDGSQALPFKTDAPAKARIPFLVNDRLKIFYNPGSSTTATEDYEWTPIKAKRPGEFIEFRTEERDALGTEIPGAFIETKAGSLLLTAAAGTDGRKVVDAGLSVNEYADASIEFLDGLAAGERRTIQTNTVTDVIPLDGWGVGKEPAPGDTYRIFLPGVKLTPPDPDGSDTFKRFKWIGGDVSPPNQFPEVNPVTGGYSFVNLQMGNSPTFSQHLFGEAFYMFHGVLWPDSGVFIFADSAVVNAGPGIVAPFGLFDQFPDLPLADWGGYALANQDIAGPFFEQSGGIFNGYLRSSGRIQMGDVEAFLFGGYASALRVFGGRTSVLGSIVGFGVDAIKFVMESFGTSSPCDVSGGVLDLGNVDVRRTGAGALGMFHCIGPDSHLVIGGDTTTSVIGGPVVEEANGGRIYLPDAPVIGGGGGSADWIVNKSERIGPFDRTDFAADRSSAFDQGCYIIRDDRSFNGFP